MTAPGLLPELQRKAVQARENHAKKVEAWDRILDAIDELLADEPPGKTSKSGIVPSGLPRKPIDVDKARRAAWDHTTIDSGLVNRD